MLTTESTPNNAQSSNWLLDIPGYEELTLKVTKFSIPRVSSNPTSIGNRTEFILQESGDHVQYEDLNLTFLVDVNLLNYRRLYKWIRSNTHRGIASTTSVFVHALDNNKQFQGVEMEFLDAFPIELGEIDYDPDGTTTDVTCTISFKYTAFDFIGETDVDSES